MLSHHLFPYVPTHLPSDVTVQQVTRVFSSHTFVAECRAFFFATLEHIRAIFSLKSSEFFAEMITYQSRENWNFEKIVIRGVRNVISVHMVGKYWRRCPMGNFSPNMKVKAPSVNEAEKCVKICISWNVTSQTEMPSSETALLGAPVRSDWSGETTWPASAEKSFDFHPKAVSWAPSGRWRRCPTFRPLKKPENAWKFVTYQIEKIVSNLRGKVSKTLFLGISKKELLDNYKTLLRFIVTSIKEQLRRE